MLPPPVLPTQLHTLPSFALVVRHGSSAALRGTSHSSHRDLIANCCRRSTTCAQRPGRIPESCRTPGCSLVCSSHSRQQPQPRGRDNLHIHYLPAMIVLLLGWWCPRKRASPPPREEQHASPRQRRRGGSPLPSCSSCWAPPRLSHTAARFNSCVWRHTEVCAPVRARASARVDLR